jgi:hypothetical protein
MPQILLPHRLASKLLIVNKVLAVSLLPHAQHPPVLAEAKQ